MQRYIRIIRLSFYSFCWSDNYLLFSRQDVEHFSTTWDRRLWRWIGRGEECIWFYGQFAVYFTKFQQKLVIHNSLFLKFLRIFFLARVSGREGFCSQSNKGMSQIPRKWRILLKLKQKIFMSSERFDKFLKVTKRWASPYP